MSYKKFTSKGKKQYAMDLTPMIDVVFLLLIFFMVATNFNKFSSMNINIPKSNVKNQMQEIDEINIFYDKDEKIIIKIIGANINTDEEILEKDLLNKINKLISSHNVKSITLVADESLEYKNIIKIMSLIKEAGAENISLKTIN